MSDEDGRRSSGSTTPNSTSTYEYSHEPYETFKTKVLPLAHSLGDFGHVDVERVRGGNYNRVVLARLTSGERRLEGVFRIPRFANVSLDDENGDGNDDKSDGGHRVDSEVQDQAAVLQLLTLQNISAPRLLAFDATPANAIGSPYVLQEYSDGTPLDIRYENMSFSEKLSIVDSLVDHLLSAEQIKFPKIGSVHAAKCPDIAVKGSYFFDSRGPDLRVEIRAFDTGAESQPRAHESSTSLGDILSGQLQAWYQQQLSLDENSNPISDMWRRLCEIFEEMQALEFFSSQNKACLSTAESILYHWDLEPRNILVKQIPIPADNNYTLDETHESEVRWAIDKVIDWDRALAVPPVLARKPPVWLWDFSDDIGNSSISSDYDGDVDLLPPARYDIDGGRLSPEDQRIKKHFEDNLILGLARMYKGYCRDVYLEEAYGKGRWIRRLARFAVHGAHNSQDLTRFYHLDNEWSTARSQYTKESQKWLCGGCYVA